MNALTFTAGPWRRDGHRFIAAGTGPDAVTVCEIFSGGVGIDQADANEALIAAAPELYAAAAEVFGLLDCGFVVPDVLTDEAQAACKRAAVALLAALVKASGRAAS